MKDKVAVVTGGAGGIGSATARRLSAAGARGRDEVAALVAFLLSDDAGYMTGEIVSVDGGATTTNSLRPSGGAGRWDPASVG